jgi:Trk K+ transport system NAD-binding subunit
MCESQFLIIGNGHLAHRTMLLLKEQKKNVDFEPELFIEILANTRSKIDDYKEVLNTFQLENYSIIYILHEEDNQNLESVIAVNTLYPEIKIATALFNEKLIPHLKNAFQVIEIFNPARISAGDFVKGIYDSTIPLESTEFKIENQQKAKISKPSSLLIALIISFIFLLSASTSYFHYFEKLRWLDSFYFVVVTVTSVGYGDINLLNSTDISKIVGIVLMLTSSIFIWLILSLILDNLFRRKTERSLGRKKYNYSNHIILCGLGRLGYFVAEELVKKGEKIIIIESNVNSVHIDHFKRLGVDIYIGNAIQHEVLLDVGVERCKALIAVTNDDYSNLEIGLTARSYKENIILVLRIFDEAMADNIKIKFNIQHSKSMSFIAAKKFAALASNK